MAWHSIRSSSLTEQPIDRSLPSSTDNHRGLTANNYPYLASAAQSLRSMYIHIYALTYELVRRAITVRAPLSLSLGQIDCSVTRIVERGR